MVQFWLKSYRKEFDRQQNNNLQYQKKTNAYSHDPNESNDNKPTNKAPMVANKTRNFFVALFMSLIAPIRGAVNKTIVLQIAKAKVLYTVASSASIPLAQY